MKIWNWGKGATRNKRQKAKWISARMLRALNYPFVVHQNLKPPGYTVITSKAFTILTCYKIQNLAGGRGGIIHSIILSYFMIFYPIKKVCEYHLQNFFGTQLALSARAKVRLIFGTCYFRYLKIPSDKQLTELVFLGF